MFENIKNKIKNYYNKIINFFKKKTKKKIVEVENKKETKQTFLKFVIKFYCNGSYYLGIIYVENNKLETDYFDKEFSKELILNYFKDKINNCNVEINSYKYFIVEYQKENSLNKLIDYEKKNEEVKYMSEMIFYQYQGKRKDLKKREYELSLEIVINIITNKEINENEFIEILEKNGIYKQYGLKDFDVTGVTLNKATLTDYNYKIKINGQQYVEDNRGKRETDFFFNEIK